MDFYQIVTTTNKKGDLIVKPDFIMGPSKDYMILGQKFYAIWDEARGLWSTSEFDVFRIVERDLQEYAKTVSHAPNVMVMTETLKSAASKLWLEYNTFKRNMPDTRIQLDTHITFQGQETKRSDYVSKCLPYSLSSAPCPAYEELISTLYEPEERAKLEWAIGSIFVGDARKIQKFMVLYGEAGSGKSTVLNLIQALFEGYYVMFNAKSLVGTNNVFSTDAFRSNPLVAIQHDGDLSRIEDNSKLNSIVSHEEMEINEKYKPSYTSRMNCFLFMATNRPVRITDAKSGLIRRLIDVHPSGRRIPPDRYFALYDQMMFELGSIAQHCIDVYRSMGRNYYSQYTPSDMIEETDAFYNFVADNYLEFRQEDGITLKRAWALYKEYFEKASLRYDMPMYKFRSELKNYFEHFYNTAYVDGKQVRSYYEGFLVNKVKGIDVDEYWRLDDSSGDEAAESNLAGGDGPRHEGRDSGCRDQAAIWLSFSNQGSNASKFDGYARECPAQYATANNVPSKAWDDVTTTLGELDSAKLHYVRLPPEHIVIDFDLKDASGNKDLKLNLEAASSWPPTYAEVSQGGNGLHLHYIYDGDSTMLSRIYEQDIEVKVFTGKSSLRRRLSVCNDLDIAHISSGLPLKGEKAMVNFDAVLSEKRIRALILRNLNKEIHGYTTPSVDFIYHILEEQYAKGAKYDVTDLRPRIMAFANNSHNQSAKCLSLVAKMKFKSDEPSEGSFEPADDESDLVFYDVEVFPNLFLVNYKVRGPDKKVVRLINPIPQQMEELMKMKLVGFNCRRYDNHMIYACYLGYSNLKLFELSSRIVDKDKKDVDKNCFFGEAYNLSYTDVYDFAAKKQSLKKWEIELGIHHQELGLPWDQPVPEELWPKVAEYCDNDVIATEAVFDHLQGDWTARKILASLAGMSVNSTTNSLTTKIIFGNERHPKLVYTNLATGEQS